MAKRTVIYAEDGTDLRETTVELLTLMGYDVQAHPNGKLALDDVKKMTAEGKPVLLLTDNEMPVMSGIELIKNLAAAQVRVPTIMLSGTENIAGLLEAAAVADKVDIVMEKPMNLKAFREALPTLSAKYDRLQGATPMDFATREPDRSIVRL